MSSSVATNETLAPAAARSTVSSAGLPGSAQTHMATTIAPAITAETSAGAMAARVSGFIAEPGSQRGFAGSALLLW